MKKKYEEPVQGLFEVAAEFVFRAGKTATEGNFKLLQFGCNDHKFRICLAAILHHLLASPIIPPSIDVS